MRIAYFVNQYPKVSHSFIRREILALESHGIEVVRFAIRSNADELVDPQDLEEFDKTNFLLNRSWFQFFITPFLVLFAAPMPFIRSLGLALRVGWGSDRGVIFHLIYLAEALQLRQLALQVGIDHIHAHFGTNSATIAMLCDSLGGPGYSFTVHGPDEFDSPLRIKLRDKIRRAEFVVAISSYTKSQLMRWSAPEDWEKIKVIRCGLDDQDLNLAAHPVTDVATLLCVGRLSGQKGQFLLLDAVHQAIQDYPDLQLVLAGDGPLRPMLEARINALQLDQNVRITGWLTSEQINSEIMTARAVILPSFAEGLPVVIMEAFANHRPVITTYVAGIPELVKNGVNGWLVPAGSVNLLAIAIAEALETDISKLSRMGSEGQKMVAEWHNIQTETARLVECFADAVTAHQR